jgi:hypothetical protein
MQQVEISPKIRQISTQAEKSWNADNESGKSLETGLSTSQSSRLITRGLPWATEIKESRTCVKS